MKEKSQIGQVSRGDSGQGSRKDGIILGILVGRRRCGRFFRPKQATLRGRCAAATARKDLLLMDAKIEGRMSRFGQEMVVSVPEWPRTPDIPRLETTVRTGGHCIAGAEETISATPFLGSFVVPRQPFAALAGERIVRVGAAVGFGQQQFHAPVDLRGGFAPVRDTTTGSSGNGRSGGNTSIHIHIRCSSSSSRHEADLQ